MKFRAIIEDAGLFREFQYLFVSFSKLSKECVMKIGHDEISIIVNETAGSISPLVWTEMKASMYFQYYKMEGIRVSGKENDIMISFQLSHMIRALASIRRSDDLCCKIKLTNVQFPCLNICSAKKNSEDTCDAKTVVCEVPVDVIMPCDWNMYTKPNPPKGQLEIEWSHPPIVRAIIERMRNLSPTIEFKANSLGTLLMSVESDMASINTYFKQMQIIVRDDKTGEERRYQPDSSDNDRGALVEASCTVDCKKAALFLSALQTSSLEVGCAIAPEQCIHLMARVRHGVIVQCILPAVCI